MNDEGNRKIKKYINLDFLKNKRNSENKFVYIFNSKLIV